jgi:hypothetical protein
LVSPAGDERVSPGAEVTLPEGTDTTNSDSTQSGSKWLAVGRGLVAAPELAERCLQAGARLFPDLLPRAREILLLARSRVAAGELLPAEAALPVYVRDRVVATAL